MNAHRYMIIALILSVIVVKLKAMENNGILIKTSDNEECRLPQWQIEESRALHTKQQLLIFNGKHCGALLAPIVLKTINNQKLQLFSKALDSQYFPFFVKKLTFDEKKLLFCAAGPQELDCPYIMYQFLKMYCPQEVIKNNINLHLPTAEIGDYLQGLIIADNCKNKNFTHTRSEKYEKDVACNDDGSYYWLPKILLPKPNFSGFTFPLITLLSGESDDRWYAEKFKKTVQGIGYIITPMEPVNINDIFGQMDVKENKKKLWASRPERGKWTQKIIEHINRIEHSVFSNDGKYLATSSAGEHGELMVADLTIKNNKLSGLDVLLTGHSGSISCICFNKKSTMLAAVSQKNIYVWDMQKFSLRATLECPEGKTFLMSFCNNDNTLITVTADETTPFTWIIKLWDITDFNDIGVILPITLENVYIHNITLTPLEDKIIIKADRKVAIIDLLLAKLIMDTGIINTPVNNDSSCVDAVLMPYQPILVTAAKNDHNHGSVVLWDINSKEPITTLLEDEKHLCGVGVDATGRYVVATTILHNMITTALYDDNTADCLNWIKTEPTLLQRYLLHRLYVAHKNNDSVFLHPDSPEYRILEGLSTAPCAIKEMVEKYLFKKNDANFS